MDLSFTVNLREEATTRIWYIYIWYIHIYIWYIYDIYTWYIYIYIYHIYIYMIYIYIYISYIYIYIIYIYHIYIYIYIYILFVLYIIYLWFFFYIMYIYFFNIYIYIYALNYSGFNTNTKRQMWSISWGNLDGDFPGPATDSGLHDDLRWQNEQQHDYGPAWKPTGRDLPQETNKLHLLNGKSDQQIVCFRDFQWFP